MKYFLEMLLFKCGILILFILAIILFIIHIFIYCLLSIFSFITTGSFKNTPYEFLAPIVWADYTLEKILLGE